MASYIKQIIEHVGANKAAKAEAFSFCYGRGWKAHKSVDIARKAASRDASSFQRRFGGGLPSTSVADKSGKSI